MHGTTPDLVEAIHDAAGEATVKSHISHLFDKLAVTNRVQVAIAAYRAGLVD
jgi:DNA-binding NarL/FixJ family response regulator